MKSDRNIPLGIFWFLSAILVLLVGSQFFDNSHWYNYIIVFCSIKLYIDMTKLAKTKIIPEYE